MSQFFPSNVSSKNQNKNKNKEKATSTYKAQAACCLAYVGLFHHPPRHQRPMDPSPSLPAPSAGDMGRAHGSGGRPTPGFLDGSSPQCDHHSALRTADAGPSHSSNRLDATGHSTAAAGYPNTASVWAPPPLFASGLAYRDAPQYTVAYKSSQAQPVASSSRRHPTAPPPVAYSQLFSLAYASASLMAISSTENARFSNTGGLGGGSEDPGQGRLPSSEEFAEEETRTNKKHACMMCYRTFDRSVSFLCRCRYARADDCLFSGRAR